MKENKEKLTLKDYIPIILTALGVLVLIGIFVNLWFQRCFEDDLINTVNQGVVVDKEVKDVTPIHEALFGSQRVRYNLMVKVSDSENEKTIYETFTVPEQVYYQLNIGDFIDDLNSIKETNG